MAARFPLVDLSGEVEKQKILPSEPSAEGQVWEPVKDVQWALSGTGRRFVTLPDGRLCVVFSDTAEGSPTKGDLVAWVGHKENSQCLDSTGVFRMLLLRDYGKGADGCRSLKLEADGTLVATTRLRYRADDRTDSFVSVRFRCPEKATASAEELYRMRRARADEWYLPSRLGVFYHWGLFTDRIKGKFRYNTPADFEAATGEPEQAARNMVDLAKGMGAKYIVLTLWHTCAQHMMLYPTRERSFVNKTTKDYVGPYLQACRAAGIRALLYFPSDSSGWDRDPVHPTMDPKVGPAGTVAFADCVGRVLDELKERYGDLIDGFWIDGGFPGLTCTFPSKIHSLWPKAIVIGNNHVRMTIPDVDICTTEVCPRWPTQPDYCRPDGYRLKNEFRMPPPPDDLNEDVPTMGEWEWAGVAGLNKAFIEDPHRLVKLIACSLGQRGRWNCCVGIGPLVDGTGAEPVRKAVDAMGRFVAWAGEAVYGTKGPAGTFFGAGHLYGYGFKGFCSVTQSLSDPNVFYAIVTEAEFSSDNLVLFATNGHTPKRITDLRTGRAYPFATYQSTEVSDIDWSDVKEYGATVLKFEFPVLGDATRTFAGRWITDSEMAALQPVNVYGRDLERAEHPVKNSGVSNRHILFRKAFDLGAVSSAKVYVSADDYYKLYLNGRFVGQGPAAGTVSHTYYNEIDVTPYLKAGRNVLAVHTYYQGLINRVWVSGDDRHGLILDLVADGKTVVASDTSFLTANHRAFSAMGISGNHFTQIMERYDAGAPEVGFERPDFDDAAWAKAVVHPHGGDYSLFAQPTARLVFDEIRPTKAERVSETLLRLDFGEMYVGALTFAAKGPKGAAVKIRCGQELNPDGSVRHKLRCNCDYQEEFVLSGGVRDVLNQYDYKSFRHAELVMPAGTTVDVSSIVLKAQHLPFELKAKLKYPESEYGAIWKLCVDTFRWGVQEQIQDCMDREKGYYLGDGAYTMYAYCKLTGDWAPARRFVDDFLRTASIDRGLVTCANCSLMQEIAEYPFMLVWFVGKYLDETGDREFVRKRFAALADVVDCYRERYARADGLLCNLDKWCVVEWPKNFQDGYDADVRWGKVCTDLHNVVNAWYIGAEKMLDALAMRTGCARRGGIGALEASFRKVFYDRERHLFVDREGSRHISLPGNVYAAFFGLQPPDDAAAHHAAFVKLVREKGYSTISFFQFPPLFQWLQANGEEKLFHELVLSPAAWKRNLREGATRTFEGWGVDTKWNISLFHLTMASVAAFLCDGTNKESALEN